MAFKIVRTKRKKNKKGGEQPFEFGKFMTGLIVIFLGVTFYFSEHRSFTHSIFGILILTSAVSLILIWAYQLVTSVTVLDNSYMIFAVLIGLLSFLFLNKKLLMVFLPVFFLSLFLINDLAIDYIQIILALFLGIFSHTVLDSFSPAGIKIFAPLSSKKVYKQFGLVMIFLLIVIFLFCHFPFFLDVYTDFVGLNMTS